MVQVSPALAITGLLKRYENQFTALHNVDLTLQPGEFFGLLGPNGAGKTTLISCTVGLARPTSGSVHVFGHDVVREPIATKRLIGFAPQEVNVEYFFPIERIMEFQGGYFGLALEEARRRTRELFERFELWEKRDVQYFRLSGGMKKRLMICRALIGNPRLLILDEPTAGVDVEQRHELWRALQTLKSQGVTILLTSHYIDEIELLCERVAVIDHGNIVEEGAPKALIAKHCRRRVEITLSSPMTLEEMVGFAGTWQLDASGCVLSVDIPYTDGTPMGEVLQSALCRVARGSQRHINDLRMITGDLEEVFLKVTGRHLEGAKVA